MKTLLVAVNSQYVHTNLAVLYLKAASSKAGIDVKVLQFSVNEGLKQIFGGIVREKPDVVAFSCYVWNIEYVVKLIEDIKKADSGIVVIAGGPEISFDNGGLLSGHAGVDFLIGGEGEEKLPFLLKLLMEGKRPDKNENEWLMGYSVIEDLNQLPSPYLYIYKGSLKHKIAYLETTRGCPFHCAFCISSVSGGVRTFNPERVYRALEELVESGSEVIKFVDRTFNANEKRVLDILNHILKFSQKRVVFHFEIAPEILTEKTILKLADMPPGLVQIEAGIQSIHDETLGEVERFSRVDIAFTNLQRILSMGNIHLHVDLIAGLPFETYPRFKESFNRVYGLFTHHFQLGFLKLLRGTALREKSEHYGYRYRNYPPYEIISNRCLSANEVLVLKDIEACLDLFYNSGRIVITLKWIHYMLSGIEYFDFYEKLAYWMRTNGYLDKPVKVSDLYEILHIFIKKNFPVLPEGIIECMRFDYLRSMKNPSIPAFMRKEEDAARKRRNKKKVIEYRTELEQVLPRLKKIPMNDILHQIYVTTFKLPREAGIPADSDIAFDFGDICPVTGFSGTYQLGAKT